MAAILCIPPDQANKLKAAAQRGEINLAAMYDMSSAGRNALFKKFVGNEETAKFLNAGFEKAMLAEDQKALLSWAKNAFTPKEQKIGKGKDIFAKIEQLKELGALDPKGQKQFLSDLVATRLGATVTADEAKIISEKANKLDELAKGFTKLGNPNDNPRAQLEYWKAKRDMENYLKSLTPSSDLRVLTSTVARGNMLFRAGSILVNINSNNIEGATSTLVRRYAERQINGSVGAKPVFQYMKNAMKVYKEAGYDITRMQSLDVDTKTLGENINSSQGEGAIKKLGRIYEDKVFGLTQGLPDVMASSFAFADRANLFATRQAIKEGLKGQAIKTRALEIFNDATAVQPQTDIGKLARENAIADAMRSTNQDERILAKKALEIRNLLNIGDFKLGDMTIPFVKTTANAIQSGLEGSGVTIPFEVAKRTIDMLKFVSNAEGKSGYKGFFDNAMKKKNWQEAVKESWSKFGEIVVRAGLSSTVGLLIASTIKSTDFVGDYPTTDKERELFKMRNSIANSVRINVGGQDRWISLDWLGNLRSSVIGAMYAKKYGYSYESKLLSYIKGGGREALNVPGLNTLSDNFKTLKDFFKVKRGETGVEVGKDLANMAVDFVKSRFVAGVVADIAKLLDTKERRTSAKDGVLAPLQGVIPGLRNYLPAKKDSLGNEIPTEGLAGFIFGGRQKATTDTPLTKELARLQDMGKMPPIGDIFKTSTRAESLRMQIGDKKYREAQSYYQDTLRTKLEKLIQTGSYKNANVDMKVKIIKKMKDDIFETTLGKYGYRKSKAIKTELK